MANDNFLATLTIGNLVSESPKLWASVVGFYYFTLVSLYVFNRTYRDVGRATDLFMSGSSKVMPEADVLDNIASQFQGGFQKGWQGLFVFFLQLSLGVSLCLMCIAKRKKKESKYFNNLYVYVIYKYVI